MLHASTGDESCENAEPNQAVGECVEEKMKTKTVKRHHCDFCRKASFQRPAMERHEAACFKNPSRKCPVCFDAPEHKPDWESKSNTVSAIGAECPACLVSKVVMHNAAVGRPDEDSVGGDYVDYPNFKEELRAFRDSKIDKSEQIKHDLGFWTM